LIAGREWLFEGNSYYADTSHVSSVIRFSVDLTDAESLGLAGEIAEYGTHLARCFTSAPIRRSTTFTPITP